MPITSKEPNITEQLFTSQAFHSPEHKVLILPPSVERHHQGLLLNIRDKVKQVEFRPKYINPNYYRWRKPAIFALLILGVVMHFLSFDVMGVFLAALSVPLILFSMSDSPNQALSFGEMDYLKIAAHFNPQITAYIAELEQKGQQVKRQHFNYLNIEQQVLIIRTEQCKQRLRNCIHAVPNEKDTEIQQSLNKIPVKDYWQYNSRNKRWGAIATINKTLLIALVVFIAGYNLIDFETTIEIRKAVIYGCMIVMLLISCSAMTMIQVKEYCQDFNYDLERYDNLKKLSQYNPAIRNYLKQVVEDDRLLTAEDFERLNYHAQLEQFNYLKNLAEIKNIPN